MPGHERLTQAMPAELTQLLDMAEEDLEVDRSIARRLCPCCVVLRVTIALLRLRDVKGTRIRGIHQRGRRITTQTTPQEPCLWLAAPVAICATAAKLCATFCNAAALGLVRRRRHLLTWSMATFIM